MISKSVHIQLFPVGARNGSHGFVPLSFSPWWMWVPRILAAVLLANADNLPMHLFTSHNMVGSNATGDVE